MENLDGYMSLYTQYLDKTGMQHKDYQYDGVRRCLHSELRIDPPCNVRGGFVADEMGLGKTIMMIGTFYANPLKHTLLVLPPVIIEQWNAQITRTTDLKPLIYHGKNKQTTTLQDLLNTPIVITSYGAITLTKKQQQNNALTLLHQVQWDRIVFDEAHHLRNMNTSVNISAKLLNANIRWLVSGTLVQNSKRDFYALCSSLKLPASYYTDTDNLKHLANNFILKRTKKQVGIDIAELNIRNNAVQWTSVAEMRLAEEIHSELDFSNVSILKSGNFVANLGSERGHKLTLMLKAKQSCIMPSLLKQYLHRDDANKYSDAFLNTSKLDSVVQKIIERKDNGAGKIIFCNFRMEIDELFQRLTASGLDVVKVDGRTSSAKRNLILTHPSDVLIMQIQTGCEGLNLQDNYSEIYFVSPHWNPAVEDQAIARCHRIGQTKPVFVHRFQMTPFPSESHDLKPTVNIEKYTSRVQDIKRAIADETIANTQP